MRLVVIACILSPIVSPMTLPDDDRLAQRIVNLMLNDQADLSTYVQSRLDHARQLAVTRRCSACAQQTSVPAPEEAAQLTELYK